MNSSVVLHVNHLKTQLKLEVVCCEDMVVFLSFQPQVFLKNVIILLHVLFYVRFQIDGGYCILYV